MEANLIDIIDSTIVATTNKTTSEYELVATDQTFDVNSEQK